MTDALNQRPLATQQWEITSQASGRNTDLPDFKAIDRFRLVCYQSSGVLRMHE